MFFPPFRLHNFSQLADFFPSPYFFKKYIYGRVLFLFCSSFFRTMLIMYNNIFLKLYPLLVLLLSLFFCSVFLALELGNVHVLRKK